MTDIERAIQKAEGMSNEDILTTWSALWFIDIDDPAPYDKKVSMKDWLDIIYSEKSKRGI